MVTVSGMLLHIVRHIEVHKPKNIVECGAGASTVILATALRALHPDSHLFSLEDNPYYVSDVSEQLARRDLVQYATVLDSPLTPRRYDDFHDIFHWYNLDSGELPETIDLLIVDGPWGYGEPVRTVPGRTGTHPATFSKRAHFSR